MQKKKVDWLRVFLINLIVLCMSIMLACSHLLTTEMLVIMCACIQISLNYLIFSSDVKKD